MGKTRLKLREYRREQRLKNSSLNFGWVNSSTESMSSGGNNISVPLRLLALKQNGHDVRSFHQQRSVRVRISSKNESQLFTSRRKQRKFPKYFIPSTAHTSEALRGGNYPSTPLYHSASKQSCCDVRPFSGQPEGQVGNYFERKNLLPASTSLSLKPQKNSESPLHTPVAYDAPAFYLDKIKRCDGNCFQIGEESSCSLERSTNQEASSATHTLISDYICNNHNPVNIYRPLAFLTTSSNDRPYSQSFNFHVLNSTSKDHCDLQERGEIESISKSINPPSASPDPMFCACPIVASDEMRSFSSPCSTVVNVGSTNSTPEKSDIFPYEAKAEPSLLSGSSQYSSEPIPYPPHNGPIFRYTSQDSWNVREDTESISQSFGNCVNSSSLPLKGNIIYPKSVSEANYQSNTYRKEDSKSSSLYISKNITSLLSKAEPPLLFVSSQRSLEPIQYAPPNSPISNSTSKESWNIQEDNESISQPSGHSRNSCRPPLMEDSLYPKTISEENGQRNTSLNENNEKNYHEWSSLHPEKRQYSSQLQRTAPPHPSFLCTLCQSRCIQNATRSISRPYLYPAVLYRHPITSSSNNSKGTNLFSESNGIIDVVPSNTPNPLLTSADRCNTENTVESASQTFGARSAMCHLPTTESLEMSVPSNEPNSEQSGQRRNEARKISRLISCFTACFRPSSPRQEGHT